MGTLRPRNITVEQIQSGNPGTTAWPCIAVATCTTNSHQATIVTAGLGPNLAHVIALWEAYTRPLSTRFCHSFFLVKLNARPLFRPLSIFF